MQSKYGVDNIMFLYETKQKIKQTCLERYGVEHYMKLQTYKDKILNSLSHKNITGKSKLEDDTYQYIKTNIDSNVIRQYKSELYPFHCDFYLPTYDVYIELNAHWTHGRHMFNKNDKNDIYTVNMWEQKAKSKNVYKDAIHIWTISDLLKIQVAKNNGINYIVIYEIKLQNVIKQINSEICKYK